ncbi:MAG: DUF835 domain-containing protein, partial [Candidatus Thermoplasmatota archaeon]|nr:DUF835 domain-containing protein [Candidatus Thermoplasmatota archaeon]
MDGKEGHASEERKKKRKMSKGYYKVDLGEDPLVEIGSEIQPLIDEKNGYLVLGRSSSSHRKWSKKGLLEIGAVGEHQKNVKDLVGKKVFLDAAFPHIIFICGKRGSGKSYTLGIFAEELIRSSIGVGVILVDPIGIFWSLKMENSSKREVEALEDWNLSPTSFPEVKVLAPGMENDDIPSNCDGHFSIGVAEMAPEDWCQLFGMDRFKTQGLLVGTAVDIVRRGYQAMVDDTEIDIPGKDRYYSIGDIIQCMETSTLLTSKTGGFNLQTRRSVIARFQAASNWGLFSVDGTPLKELTSSNRATVLDISDPNIGDAKRSLLTGIIARKILEGRIYSARKEEDGNLDDSDPESIPLTWLLIDEAHIILPHGKQTPATKALIEYAKQGRRPGCALVLATQRPASTSDEILSQVDLLIGHNLALEDDMTALRRRVPAKLPPEFASSDFIRAIPVGTAIIADQKTQQRSFLMKVRPRLSHHAGSSAMPKAFMEKRKKRKIPITGTYASASTGASTIRSMEDKGSKNKGQKRNGMEMRTSQKEEDISNFPLKGIPWGSSILVEHCDKESLEAILERIEKPSGILLFSRAPPSNLIIPEEVPSISFWLSSTPSEGTIHPKNLQDISMEIDSKVSNKKNWIIVLEGVEYLFHNNGMENVQRLLEILHEKAFLGKHLLLIRADNNIENNCLEAVSTEMDHTIQGPIVRSASGKTKEDTQADEPLSNGSLSSNDLEWMCDVMGIPSEGNESDLLDRIVKHELESNIEDPGENKKKDPTKFVKEMIRESTNMREENDKLRKKLDELEYMFSSRKKEKEKRVIIEWDGSESEERIKDLFTEISSLKERIGSIVRERDEKEGGDAFEKVLRKMEDDRITNLEKLTRIEEVIYGEIEGLREKMVEKGMAITSTSPAIKKTNGSARVGLKGKKKMKNRVVKEGVAIPVIPPSVGTNTVTINARKKLKRSFFRGTREVISDIKPFYIPIY